MGAILPLKRDHATQLPAEPQSGDNGLIVGQATLDASGLTAARTLVVPDASGTLQVAGHYDGGNASSVYTTGQHTFNGGGASG